MLDKQYSRVIRWIRRAQTMSAGGNFSDAILDVECARAELDDARQELLLCHQAGNARRGVRAYFMILPAAVAAVLSLASPLHMPDAASVSLQTRQAGRELSRSGFPGTLPLQARRYGERPTADERNGAPAGQGGEPLRAAEEKALPEPAAAAKNAARPRQSVSKLSDADMYRLMEVGRKALHKSNNSVVLEFN